jgi:hypothetical protein
MTNFWFSETIGIDEYMILFRPSRGNDLIFLTVDAKREVVEQMIDVFNRARFIPKGNYENLPKF